jgi:hypothetical protein
MAAVKKKLEKALNRIEDSSDYISLENKEAVITMENHITKTLLRRVATLGNYTIKMGDKRTAAVP